MGYDLYDHGMTTTSRHYYVSHNLTDTLPGDKMRMTFTRLIMSDNGWSTFEGIIMHYHVIYTF